MDPSNPLPTAELLIEHAAWLRRLATYLVRDGIEADDVVQQTWEAALVSPPDPDRPPRPWLARVLHNTIRSTARASSRRRARESADTGPSEAPAPEELLARMQLQEQIARLISALEEPYRTTLLLRFYQGRSAAEMARAQGIPAGTVRWRLNEGLRRLRARLDELQGERPWRATLLPLAAPELRAPPGWSWLGVGAVAAGATIALVTVGALVLARSGRPAPLATVEAAAPRSSPVPPTRPIPRTKEEETMSNENLKRAAAFLGVALPALVASAQGTVDPRTQQSINLCVQMRERIFECKEEFAEVFVAKRNPRPEQRNALRRKAIEEITKDGSGPLEPRQQACANGPRIPPEYVDKAKKKLDECVATTDCKARVACMNELLRSGEGKAVK